MSNDASDVAGMMTITVTATITIRYTMSKSDALKAFGTDDPTEIARVEQANCVDGGDYFISMLDGNLLSDDYTVTVTGTDGGGK